MARPPGVGPKEEKWGLWYFTVLLYCLVIACLGVHVNMLTAHIFPIYQSRLPVTC